MERSDFLRQVIDINPHFIFVKDREGRFTLVNEALAEAYGTTVEELIGKTDADFNDKPEEVEWFRRDDLEVMDSLQEKLIPQEVITDAQGRVRYLQTIKRPVVDEDGMARRVLGVATDITILKQAEEERRDLEAQVQHAQKLESLGVLAGGIAHDFNNLLVGILTNADVLKRAVELDSSASKSLESIQIAAERAADLCTQMLAYSGRGHFVIEAVALNDVILELHELLAASVSKKAAVQYELQESLLDVDADPSQMRQLVMNLITNASEALEDGTGSIHVRTGTVTCHSDDLRDTCTGERVPPGDYVYLEVEDTGTGLETESIRRIFDPFYTTKVSGRGLGLAAVLGIVRGHRGAILLRSSPEKGTQFRVLLPVAKDQRWKRPEPQPTTVSTPLDPAIVLVVDDEPIVLNAIRRVLEQEGVEVLTAHDGEGAVEIIRQDPGRVTGVLLDLTMPRKGGDEVLSELHEIRRDLPVVVMSGFDQSDAAQRFRDAPPTGFLKKPFRADAVIDAVRHLVTAASRSSS